MKNTLILTLAFSVSLVIGVDTAVGDSAETALLKRKAAFEAGLARLTSTDLAGVKAAEVTHLKDELDALRADLADEKYNEILAKLDAIHGRVKELSALKLQQATIDSKIELLKMRRPPLPLLKTERLFPELAEHYGAFRCGVFDAASKTVEELFKDSGYSQDELKLLKQYESSFGRNIPGARCVSIPFDSKVDAEEEWVRIFGDLEEHIRTESNTDNLQVLHAQRGMLKDLLATFHRHQEERKQEMLAVHQRVQAAIATQQGQYGADLQQNLVKRLAALNEERPRSCIPCEEGHRNDLLLFLASQKHYASHLQDLKRLEAQFDQAKQGTQARTSGSSLRSGRKPSTRSPFAPGHISLSFP